MYTYGIDTVPLPRFTGAEVCICSYHNHMCTGSRVVLFEVNHGLLIDIVHSYILASGTVGTNGCKNILKKDLFYWNQMHFRGKLSMLMM